MEHCVLCPKRNAVLSAASLGLQHEVYEVLESEGRVEVCVVVPSPISDCPIAVPFTVIITAVEDSARKSSILCAPTITFCLLLSRKCVGF